ncbi:MAG: aldolase [Candidatus Accumulibacter sp.]|uniref:3-oxo-tetronate 4-phosphate decarboxylase n=1 Tax=Accumulibacter sp. TaxID=2053492 RepID=UPI001A059559|nr:3-oxo-tetronate 4-phosphate decarboxylase [Accumulibacter sp.]MBE2259948.1 aldolase [Paracoccaceae bacterium]MCP5248281.1 aldolase [Accumulibacter sp.]
MSAESAAREALCRTARSLYERGLTHGSTGNLSLRLDDGYLLTPTGASLGELDPARLARLDGSGRHLAGDQPTKESFLHLAMYRQRPASGAVVHLHSTHSVAVSVLAELDASDLLPPLTAYYVMRIGCLPLVPYFPPGDAALADAVCGLAGKHHALLLANHGPVVAGSSLSAATDAVEELEATARLYLLLRGQPLRLLSPAQVAELRRRYP